MSNASFYFTNVGRLLCLVIAGWGLPAPGQNAAPASFESWAQAATADREAGHTQEAMRDYQRALETKADWTEGWWYLATLQYDSHRFAEAGASFHAVVRLLPSMGSAWNFLGLCEFETRDFATARAHLEKGEELGSGDDPEIARVAAYHLALLRIRSGDFEGAMLLLNAHFPEAHPSEQIRNAFGLALLRVPLLPAEVDPSRDALLHEAGEAAFSTVRSLPDRVEKLRALVEQYPQLPYLHYAYGTALAASGRNAEARESLRIETQISDQSALPWIELSRLDLLERRFPEARRAAERAVRLAPQSRAAHEILDEAMKAEGNNNVKPELQFAESRKALDVPIDHAVARLYAAPSEVARTDEERWRELMSLYASGQYPEAAAALRQWLLAKPNDGTAWAVLGLVEFAQHDYDNAQLHLQRGSELGFGGSPESVQLANYRLGLLLNRSRQFESASKALMRAQTGPRAEEVQFALGMSLLRMALFPEQVAPDLRSVVQHAGRAAELLQSSQYDQAFVNLQELLKQSPRLPFLHYAYGTALIALSRYDEAKVQMREELILSPESELPYLRLASIAIRQHRPAEAEVAAQAALKRAPSSGEAHYLLGRACLENGDAQTAVRELELAAQIVPNSPEIHFNLAKAYARAKQNDKAEQERATFVRLNAVAEQQRSPSGGAYQGPRDANDLAGTSATPPR